MGATVLLQGPNPEDQAVVDQDSEALHTLTSEGWTVVEQPTEETPAEEAPPAEDAKPAKKTK